MSAQDISGNPSIGIYILCCREEPDDKSLQPMLGVRASRDLPGQVMAVASEHDLESMGFERIGENLLVTTAAGFTEHIVQGPLEETARIFFTHDFLSIDAEFLGNGFLPGLLGAWKSQSEMNIYLLAYASGSYNGGVTEDKSTFGSALYIVAAMNLGLVVSNDSANRTQ